MVYQNIDDRLLGTIYTFCVVVCDNWCLKMEVNVSIKQIFRLLELPLKRYQQAPWSHSRVSVARRSMGQVRSSER